MDFLNMLPCQCADVCFKKLTTQRFIEWNSVLTLFWYKRENWKFFITWANSREVPLAIIFLPKHKVIWKTFEPGWREYLHSFSKQVHVLRASTALAEGISNIVQASTPTTFMKCNWLHFFKRFNTVATGNSNTSSTLKEESPGT